MKIEKIKNLLKKTKLYELKPDTEVEISLYVRTECSTVINDVCYTEKLEKIVLQAIYLGVYDKNNELNTLKNCINTCDKEDIDVIDINLSISNGWRIGQTGGQSQFYAWPDMITEDEVELFFSDRCRNNTSKFKMKI